MIKENSKQTFITFVFIGIAILLSSCTDEFQLQKQYDKAIVSFSITDNSPRTVFPQVSFDNVKSYILLGGMNGEVEKELLHFLKGNNIITIGLLPGNWNFSLNAYNEDNELILQGNILNKEVSLSGPNQVNFLLSTINSGYGNVQITLKYPDNADITLIKISGDFVTEEFNEITDSSFIFIKNNVPSSDYFINFEIYSGDILRSVISELILVRNNLTSSKTITLVGDDLKPLLTGTVTITGIAYIGNTLIADISSLDGIGTISYQWKRENINVGANNNTYIIQNTDIDESITVTVKRDGYVGDITSLPTAIVSIPTLESVSGLSNKLAWLQNYAQSNTNYIIEVNSSETISSTTLSYSGRSNIEITLIGIYAGLIVKPSTNATLFTVDTGVVLILENINLQDNVPLQNSSSTNPFSPVLRINNNGKIIMNSGVSISYLYQLTTNLSTLAGGGIYIAGGELIMNDGQITGSINFSGTAPSVYGGGIYVTSNGTFIMNGGLIRCSVSPDNFVTSSSTSVSIYGGGVCIMQGNFILNDGLIANNSCRPYAGTSNSYAYSYGGGVYIGNNGNFIFNNGKINNNTVTAVGLGNTSKYSYGGGIYLTGGTITMNGGEISSNKNEVQSISAYTPIGNGGGVYINSGTFTMKGGVISGNSSPNGGGVFVNGGTLRIVTGTIYGLNEAITNIKNTSTSEGAALYSNSSNTQFGIFDGNTWNSNGTFNTTDSTIMIVNGVDIRPPLSITTVAITDIVAPVTGAVPSTASSGIGNFTRGNVTWSPTHIPFHGGTIYTASITLKANSGYTFTGLTTATINENTAIIGNNTGMTVILSREFSATANSITTVAITSVAAPVTGALPSTVSASIGNFSRGNVTWSPTHSPFRAGQTYTASITLTANNGYTLTGLTTATINGSAATISNNTGSTVTLTCQFHIIEMVSIHGGTFTMGSSDSLDYLASPPHHVTISKGFYMGKYEVTQEQYQAVTGLNPSYFHGGNGREPTSGEIQGRRPVESLSWYDAIVFCNRLSIKEGLTPAYRISNSINPNDWGTVPTSSNATWDAAEIVSGSTGYRLPTEAQWEYACRAGTTTAYNTGNTISDSTGWYLNNSNSKTHEVGLKPPNAWGLYDMHGNVDELCWDWLGNYSDGAQTDPTGAASGVFRVVRGGSWYVDGQNLRSAYRLGIRFGSNYRAEGVGFRLIRP